ncbi:anti-sigma factor [Aquimarina aggregata]|uniref:anti-sigma factor n=1 Tax=Aquimarina aggregata TaxID=1642818 RepID=UPI00249198A6|nr:anti-sigma factor [Aquimarina aggregata]
MMTKRTLVVALSIVSLFITSCSSDDGPPTSNLTLELIGLEPLTGGASYEAWLVVDGEPVSINKFSSVGTTTVFPVVTTTLESATEFFLSIEAPNDADPKPSKTRILTGTFTGSVA